MDEIWFKAYTTYQKDPRILDKWLQIIRENPVKALETARKLTIAEAVPDTLTLGFSPQVLVAVLAVNHPNPVKVLTSPEVAQATHPAAKHSHQALRIYEEIGLIKQVETTPMTPNNQLTPKQVIEEVKKKLRKLNPKTIDISGGTQLTAIAITQTTNQLTYTYPHGKQVKIHKI